MNTKDKTNSEISFYLLSKHWDIFNTLDTRRIKSFFHLYYFNAIMFLFLIKTFANFGGNFAGKACHE